MAVHWDLRVPVWSMRPAIVLGLGLLVSASAWGDIVHLKNGNTLEGVVTELTDSQVAIQLEFGRIVLLRSSVQRVETRSHELEEYLRRRELLEQAGGGPAKDWLELARWARLKGLDHSAMEAVRTAARLEPELEGLSALMRELGYVYDDQLERWIPYEGWMRRRGFVWHRGEWLTTSELEGQERRREAEERERSARERQDRLTQAMELLVLAQLEQLASQSLQTPGYAGGGYAVGGYPIAWIPGFWRLPHPLPHPTHRATKPHHRKPFPAAAADPSAAHRLLRRQPGSIIPVGGRGSVPHHRGSFSAPGTHPGLR